MCDREYPTNEGMLIFESFNIHWIYKGNMNEELEVLSLVTQALDDTGIAYMITGSIAMNYYATPRMTRDVDIVIELHRRDIDSFIELFQQDFYLNPDSIKEAVINHEMFNIIHSKYVLKLDFIVKKESPYRVAEFQRRRQVVIDGIPISIVSLEDLVLSKLFWAKDTKSELQIRDVKNMLFAEHDIDLQYIHKWVKEMNLQEVYRMAKDE